MSVPAGARLSRRAFLGAAAASGLAVAGVTTLARGAVRPARSGPPQAAEQPIDDPIGDLAARLGYDVESILRFVSDEIAYQPYAGALRGPLGTLAARAGNSVDQAALLAALLDASLVSFRFAVGRLDDQGAAAVLAAAARDATSTRAAVLQGATGWLPGDPPAGATPADAGSQAILDRARAAGGQVVAWATDQLTATLSDIEAALGDRGLELPASFSVLPLREVDRHTWVQQRLGMEWQDLDPTLPGQPAGAAIADPAETMDALPDEAFHRVRIAVIAERTDGDRLTTETLLDVVERADLLAGVPITFVNARPEGIERLAEAMTPLAGVTTYVPSLILGDEAFAGRAIRFGRPADAGDDLLGDGDPFGGGSLGGETTAEWLEVTVMSPDAEPVVARRTIFDRFGPEARAGGALDPTTLEAAPMLVPDDGGAPEVLAALPSTWLMVGVGGPSPRAPVLGLPVDHVGRPGVFAYSQQVFREIADLGIGLALGSRSFVDAPNVAAYSIASSPGPDGAPWVELAMDLWHRSRGSLPLTDVSATAPPAAVAGILDHVVERLIMGHAAAGPADAADDGLRAVASVGSVFDAARVAGTVPRVAQTSAEVQALGLPPAATALLLSDIAAGWLAVVPGSTVDVGGEARVGWWLVDPETGRVSDRLDDGRGAAQGIEYQATLTPGQLARETAEKKLARDCLAAAALAAAAIIAGIVGGVAVADDRAALALAAGAGGAGAAAGSGRPLGRCLGAALA